VAELSSIVSDQSVERRFADKQQELSLFRCCTIEASAAGLHCCQFILVPCVVLWPCFLMEKKDMDLYIQTYELIYSIHNYLILCMQILLTKQFAFTENHCSTVLHLASPYYVSWPPFPPNLLPTKPQYMWLVQALAINFSEKLYKVISRLCCCHVTEWGNITLFW
jgi:hypothetical protein